MAIKAYGYAIETDLAKAIQDLRNRPLHLGLYLEAMQIATVPKALLWKRVKTLSP